MLQPFKNAKGSVISRGGKLFGHTYKIGKVIGGKVYLHIDYIDELPNPEQARIAMSHVRGIKPRTVSYDPRAEVYWFNEAPGFDKHSEPAPGKTVRVEMDGDDVDQVDSPKDIKQIWHHKWMWVGDDYRGFDVAKSYQWSKKLAAEISNPSGSLRLWKKQLLDAGLIYDIVESRFRFDVISEVYLNEKNKIRL